ncbi:hypothetical protein HYQ46_009804 [Verticillium longisporum]|nr:hypothetical protein HYQ46_009804 [Verticillium longisporum]
MFVGTGAPMGPVRWDKTMLKRASRDFGSELSSEPAAAMPHTFTLFAIDLCGHRREKAGEVGRSELQLVGGKGQQRNPRRQATRISFFVLVRSIVRAIGGLTQVELGCDDIEVLQFLGDGIFAALVFIGALGGFVGGR